MASSASPILVYDEAQEAFGTWIFDPPTSTKNGGRTVYIHSNSSTSSSSKKSAVGPHPRIQLCKDNDPHLICPFGLGSFQEHKQQGGGGNGYTTTTAAAPSSSSSRLTLDLSVTHPPLLEFLQALDSQIIDVAYSKCKEWFNKELTREQIASMYRPCLTQKSDSYPATIRTKLTLKGGAGAGGRPVSIWKVVEARDGTLTYASGTAENITRGSEVWASVDVTSMYFMSTLFGCTLTVADLLVFPSRQSFPFLTAMNVVAAHDADDDDSDVIDETNSNRRKKYHSGSGGIRHHHRAREPQVGTVVSSVLPSPPP